MKVEEIETVIQKVVQRILTQEPQESQKPVFTIGVLSCPAQTLEALRESASEVSWRDPMTESCQALLVNQLTLSQIAAIAHLQKTDKITSFVIDYLLAGKKVYVVNPATVVKEKKEQKKYQLFKKVKELWQQCQDYGVVWLTEPSLLTAATSFSANLTGPAKPNFITEQQLMQMYENNQVNLKQNDRLTPLAYDFAKEHQLLG